MTPLRSLHRPVSRVKHASWSLLLFALAAALPDLRAQTIPNPSFQVDNFTVLQGLIQQNTPITGWTASNTNRIGLNPAASSPFADNGAIPNGTRVAFLQSVGGSTSTLSTTITGLVVGTSYRVQFRANARNNNGFSDPPLPSYRLNGGAPVSFAAPSVNDTGVFTNPYHTISGIFTATATTAALEISNTGTADSTLLVDNFTIAAATAIQVTNANNDGPGSLRQVLITAAATPVANVITFAAALNGQTITLLSEIVVNDAGGVIIDASALAAGITIDGGPNDNRIFTVGSSALVSLRKLTLTGGNGGSTVQEDGDGGAIINEGTLLLTQCTLSNNSGGLGGAIDNYSGGPPGLFPNLALTQCTLTGNTASDHGGAILNSGQLNLTQCTLTGNHTGDDGGAISNFSLLALTQCTFSGNTAVDRGGAIDSQPSATLAVTHCTISDNTASSESGIRNAGTFTLTNSIVKNSVYNTSSGSTVLVGANLVSTLNSDGSGPGISGAPNNTANPLLDVLASNGGPTQTVALLPSSPARNAAAVLVPAITTDQRGKAIQGVADIGAYEVQKGTFVLSSSVYLVNESAGTKTVTIRRTDGFEGAASVKITSAPGTATAADFTAIPVGSQIINFADDDNADRNLAIAINPDAVVETSESFSVALSLPSAGTALGTPATATVTILDPPVVTFAGDNVAPTVTLTSPANASTPGLAVGASLAVAGSAADNKGVRKVQYSLNGGAFTDATLGTPGATSTAWSASVVPISGSNTLSVRSVDFAQQLSPINATVTGSSTGSKTVTLLSVPLGLVVNSDFMGGTVTAISGNTVTLSGNANATTAFVQVTSSAINSPTVEVTNVEAGLAVGSTLLGRTVTNIVSNTITLNGNANAAIATPTFVAFTPVVTVNSSSLATPTVVVANVPSILNVGSTLLGRSVTNIVSTTITLNGNANAATGAPTARPFGAAVPTSFTTTDRISTVVTNTFKVLRPLGVQIAGNGSVTPAGFSPTSFREVGQMFLMTAASAATPAPGTIFKNWEIVSMHSPGNIGIPLSALEKPTLNFIHRDDLVLRANFVPNPYAYGGNQASPGLGTNSAGTSGVEYNGLIHADPDEPNPAPNGTQRSNSTEGLLTATVTSTGSFSGLLKIDGSVLNMAGAFDQNGVARFGSSRATTFTVARVGKPSLIVELSIDLDGMRAKDTITGTVSARGFKQSVIEAVSEVVADRAFYDGLSGPTTVPAAYLGAAGATQSYTVVLPSRPPFETFTADLDGSPYFDMQVPNNAVGLRIIFADPAPNGLTAGDVYTLVEHVGEEGYFRLIDSAGAPAPFTEGGNFTVTLPDLTQIEDLGLTEQDYPQGDGYGLLSITKAGVVTLTAGKLADGSGWTTASTKLSKDNKFPLFLPLYGSKGYLSGDVALDASNPESDLAAVNLDWFRPFDGTSHYYPYGWTEVIRVGFMGARYAATFTPASSVLRISDDSDGSDADLIGDPLLPPDLVNGNAGLSFYEGQLTEDLDRHVNISTTNVVTKVPASDTSFTLTLTAGTGLFSGTFVHENDQGVPVPLTTNYEGIIYQKGHNPGGYGFFLTRKPTPIDYTGESGAVNLYGFEP